MRFAMPHQDTPPKNVGVDSSRWDRAALAGAAILVVGAAAVSVVALRGPLSLETLTSGMNRPPRAIWPLLALALGAPSIVATSDFSSTPRRALWERIVAAFAALAGALLAWKLPTAWPRAAFDEWERSFAVTHAGIPWSAVVAMVLAAFLALNFALAARRVILARPTQASSPRPRSALYGAVAALAGAVLAFALPASATVYLATGTRLVPVGAPDELWAPALDEALCPPSASASPSPSPRVAASAAKP